MVLFGADRVAEFRHLFVGRTALLTGPSGRTSGNAPTIDVLKACCDLRLKTRCRYPTYRGRRMGRVVSNRDYL